MRASSSESIRNLGLTYAVDQPTLLAAIHRKADYLLTSDDRHFGHLYEKRIEGVLVLRPSQYFERRRRP